MPIIKVENGEGFFLVNNKARQKNTFPVIPLGNGQIQIGRKEKTVALGMFSDYVDGTDTPFASESAAMTYLNNTCFQ